MKEIGNFIRRARDNGWNVSKTNKNHLRLTKPNACPVFVSSTTGDWRCWRNAERDMRKAERNHKK